MVRLLAVLLVVGCGSPAVRSHHSVDASGPADVAVAVAPQPEVASLPEVEDVPPVVEDAAEPVDLTPPEPDVPPPPVGIDPSNGVGGPLGPGESGATPLGATLRLPSTYASATAAPVVWLFNEQIASWSAIADADDVVLVDLAEYNDVDKIVAKLNETQTILEAGYQVDKARYYWAGWSAGGNLAIIIAAQNQGLVAGTLVFPGTGGNLALDSMKANTGHNLRLFYACGDADPNFAWAAVENEAKVWGSMGYGTKFVKVSGAPHYLDEATYGVRATGWDWMREFNLAN